MIREALAKLNEKQIKYCETLSAIIAEDKKKGCTHIYLAQHSGKLRGYLECLVDSDIITHVEMQGLYLWFCSGERRKEIKK